MKKYLIFSCTLLIVSQTQSIAQNKTISAVHFTVDGNHYYQVNGCIAQSDISFYSDQGGGKLLQTQTTDINGEVFFKGGKEFKPAFVLNLQEKNKLGIKGSGFVYFMGPKSFTLSNLSINADKEVILKWDASFNETENYEMEILKSVDGINYQSIGLINPSSIQESEYQFVDKEAINSSSVSYKVKFVNQQKSIQYVSDALYLPEQQKLQIFPNIVANSINISYESSAENDNVVSYSIINSVGQVVQQAELDQLKLAKIKVDNFVPGNYIISIITTKGKKINAPFVKL